MPVDFDEQTWTQWYESLSPAEQAELAKSLENSPRVAPQAGPQTDAFLSEADVLGYGGAAGGGKSALIAILALLNHERTVIFRNDKAQMGGLIDDLVQFYGSDTGLNRQAAVFRLADRPNHVIEWGGLGAPGDQMKWRGRPHDLFCVDEATEVPWEQVRFVQTWVRTTTPGQRCRSLYTFNPPGGPGDESGSTGRWVIDYFAPWLNERHPNPAVPGELRWFLRDEKGVEREANKGDVTEVKIGDHIIEARAQSRTFIPATVVDNEYLARDGTYVSQLASLPEPYRSKMLYGDFRSGITDHERQVIPRRGLTRRWTGGGTATGRRGGVSATCPHSASTWHAAATTRPFWRDATGGTGSG